MGYPFFPGRTPGTYLVPQGILTRTLAYLIDSLAVAIPMAVYLTVRDGSAASAAASFSESYSRAMSLQWWIMGALLVYFFFMEAALGRTLGKMALRLTVVSAVDGGRCGLSRALVRNLLRPVDLWMFTPLPGLVAIAVSPRRQRLGDHAARTLVVREVPEAVVPYVAGRMMTLPGPAAAAGGPPGPARPGAANPAAGDEAGGLLSTGLPGGITPPEQLMACPYCHEPVPSVAVVCDVCRHYINQLTAAGDNEEMAPKPLLWSDDRQTRFDALWRLAFEGDDASLAALEEAVPHWRPADRRDAVFSFSQVADPRPLPFLDFMGGDEDGIIAVLAREAAASVRSLVGAKEEAEPPGELTPETDS